VMNPLVPRHQVTKEQLQKPSTTSTRRPRRQSKWRSTYKNLAIGVAPSECELPL
jgi:hypothetical protein